VVNQSGGPFSLGVEIALRLPTVVFGVKAGRERDADAAGGDQQPHDEARGRPPRRLLLLAVALAGPLAVVAATEGVLATSALAATEGLVDVEDEEPLLLGLQGQPGGAQRPEEIGPLPVSAAAEATDLGAMSGVGADGAGGLGGGHLAEMHQEGDQAAEEQTLGASA